MMSPMWLIEKQPTPYSRIILEKLIVAQLPQLKHFLAFYVCCVPHCYVYQSIYHNTTVNKQQKT
jgi:hypothetical protein